MVHDINIAISFLWMHRLQINIPQYNIHVQTFDKLYCSGQGSGFSPDGIVRFYSKIVKWLPMDHYFIDLSFC